MDPDHLTLEASWSESALFLIQDTSGFNMACGTKRCCQSTVKNRLHWDCHLTGIV